MNPNSTVKAVSRQQKHLSEAEVLIVCKKYRAGASVYELAEEFGCHRRTISDTLKRNGVKVSHKASAKPELVKKIIKPYAKYKIPKEIEKKLIWTAVLLGKFLKIMGPIYARVESTEKVISF